MPGDQEALSPLQVPTFKALDLDLMNFPAPNTRRFEPAPDPLTSGGFIFDTRDRRGGCAEADDTTGELLRTIDIIARGRGVDDRIVCKM